jgi:hypothetical protein
VNAENCALQASEPRHARLDWLNVAAPHEKRSAREAQRRKDGSDGQVDGRILGQFAHGLRERKRSIRVMFEIKITDTCCKREKSDVDAS